MAVKKLATPPCFGWLSSTANAGFLRGSAWQTWSTHALARPQRTRGIACVVHGFDLLGPLDRGGHFEGELLQNSRFGIGPLHRVERAVNVGGDRHRRPANLQPFQNRRRGSLAGATIREWKACEVARATQEKPCSSNAAMAALTGAVSPAITVILGEFLLAAIRSPPWP